VWLLDADSVVVVVVKLVFKGLMLDIHFLARLPKKQDSRSECQFIVLQKKTHARILVKFAEGTM
jgi:hypothetical protein